MEHVCCMLLFLHFPATCNPSSAVTLLNTEFPITSEFPTDLPTHNKAPPVMISSSSKAMPGRES
jgi:hypothetical protein